MGIDLFVKILSQWRKKEKGRRTKFSVALKNRRKNPCSKKLVIKLKSMTKNIKQGYRKKIHRK